MTRSLRMILGCGLEPGFDVFGMREELEDAKRALWL